MALVGAAAVGASAQAATFHFVNITGNNATNAAIGEAQFAVDVTDAGSGMVSFLFTNTSPDMSAPDPASITQTYWDDAAGVLSSISLIDDTVTSGVSFSEGGAPPDLPGGDDITPAFGADFRATADAPPPVNGVNPGEELAVFFNLTDGTVFDDVIAAMMSGGLRVGVHSQAIGPNEDSESFITTGNAVPLPTAAGMGVLSLIGLGTARRRRLD